MVHRPGLSKLKFEKETFDIPKVYKKPKQH